MPERPRIPVARLAWRNAKRHTRRTILTASAVAVAVTAMIAGAGFASGMLGNLIESYANTETGHVRIRQAGYTRREQFLPVHINIGRLPEILSTIRASESVARALPRIRTSVLVDGAESNRPALLLGLDIEGEAGYLDPAVITEAGRPPTAGQPEVLVGVDLAEKLGVGLGDTLTLLAQTAYRSLGGIRLTVSGLARSGIPYWDAGVLVAPIDQAQLLLDLPDATTEIVVFASSRGLAAEVATDLDRALDPIAPEVEVRSWQEQGPLAMMLQASGGGLTLMLGLMVLMASLVIVNTMLMTVMERTREFGVQSALGMRAGDLRRMILSEGALIGLMGATVGAVLGTVLSLVLGQTGIDFRAAARTTDFPFQGVMRPEWRLWHTLAATALGVAAGWAATLFPARRLKRLRPAEALRA